MIILVSWYDSDGKTDCGMWDNLTDALVHVEMLSAEGCTDFMFWKRFDIQKGEVQS